MAIDFPANPLTGQQYTSGGVTWTYDGVKWTAPSLGVAYLPLAGGTLTGPLVLAADPAAPLQAATAQYADRPRYGDNRIINGDMRIDQRNNGNSGTANGYTVDRWGYSGAQAGKGSWQRWGASASLTVLGFGYSLGFTSSSAYASVAADYFFFGQSIEADMVSDFAWGTASAQPVTLSFLAFSSLSGTFSGSITNYASTRSYPFSYSLPTASTWTRITVTVPGDTAGTWVMSGNGGSLAVHFDLGSGSTYRGSAGAWASANYIGATGAVSVVATNGATFYVTGVKLEVGSVATPFNRQSLTKSLADCQRYFVSMPVNVGGPQGTGTGAITMSKIYFPVTMRAAPSAITPSGSFTYNGGASSIAVGPFDATGFSPNVTFTANTWFLVNGVYLANAEL